MKAKRFLSIIMAIVMVFAMCSCASADSGESDKKESVAASEEVEKVQEDSSKEEAAETPEVTEEPAAEESTQAEVADDKENELGLTGSEMEEIYAAIEEDLQKEYLDVNNINAEDFSIPDDDESWEYFLSYISTKSFQLVSDEEYKNNVAQKFTLSEENLNVMTIISNTFYNYFEEKNDTLFIPSLSLHEEKEDLLVELMIKNLCNNKDQISKTEK